MYARKITYTKVYKNSCGSKNDLSNITLKNMEFIVYPTCI